MADAKRFKDDDGQSFTAVPVKPAGGTDGVVDKKDNGEKIKKFKEETDDDVEIVIEESIQNMFEGMDLSEDFKTKVSFVFEAAVREQASLKAESMREDIRAEFETELEESISSKMSEVVDNLDSYLGYVVNEWMNENEIAIETGVKVEIAESLMCGLKELFSGHNMDVTEETIDIVSGLEEQVSSLTVKANNTITENIRLNYQIETLNSNKVFDEMTESLTVSQRERLKNLSESLNSSDIGEYSKNLQTLKESFFAGSSVKNDVLDEENEILTEETATKRPASDNGMINALVEALNTRKSK
jgi:hypothetical protein